MRLLLIALFIAGLGISCSSSDSKSAKTEAEETVNIPAENLKLVNLNVKGMTCEGCENAVVASIRKLDGIQEAEASHVNENTIVRFDSTKTSIDAISRAVADAGYTVEGVNNQGEQN